MSIIVDWKIKPRTGVCSHSEKEFEDEEPFYTCIFADPESDGFIRRDFSIEAWKEIADQLETPPYSFWKSIHKQIQDKGKEETVKQNTAEAMLHRMIEEDDSVTENARYILALMLERKKILLPTEIKETDNRKLLFYEHKDTGSVYIVTDPQLHLEEVGSIQDEVSQLLANEENKGSAPPKPENSEHSVETPDEVSHADSSKTEDNSQQTTEAE